MRNQLFLSFGFMLALAVGVAHGQEQPLPVAVPTAARSDAAGRCAEIRRLQESGRNVIVTSGTCDRYGGPTSLTSALESAKVHKQLHAKSKTDHTPPTLADGRDTPE
jgi:hypothetical protein